MSHPNRKKFANRSNEDIYFDILSSIKELQYNESTYPRAIHSRITIHRSRRGMGTQFKPLKGAMLRNLIDKCNLSSKICKRYLLIMYTQGLIDLGLYIGNVDRDVTAGSNHSPALDKLITITDKGNDLLRLLTEMRGMLNIKNGFER